MKQERKDAVIKAIEFGKPERLPFWLNWFAPETISKYGKHLENLSQKYPDFIIMTQYEELLPGYDAKENQEWKDPQWGYTFRHVGGSVSAQIVKHPLDSWDKLPEYLANFPEPPGPEKFEKVREIVEEETDKYIVGLWWFLFFERMQALRGMENLFMDFYLHPKEVKVLGERLLEFYLVLVDRYANVGVDGIMSSDDWGSQNGLMINPELWRQIFKPWYKELVDAIHSRGLHAILHSCGNIFEIIPDLVEIGFDVLHPIQPGALDLEKVAREFKGKICFFGGIDVQYLLPKGNPHEVREGIVKAIKTLASKEGGFIAAPANAMVPDIPLENIKAMYETVAKFKISDLSKNDSDI